MNKIIFGIFITVVIILVTIGIAVTGSVAHELVHLNDLKDSDAVINQICFVGLMGNNSIWNMGGWVQYESFEEVYTPEWKAYLIQFLVVIGIVFFLLILWTIIACKKEKS